ncbi:MAG: tRNA epoxyqueuosine(34) reductase QueG [Sedimentisphaerales bacterium]|nr:tRNA epoxyqueuosine(34) reductase QueG [Sedimentisphaerales bacterium]
MSVSITSDQIKSFALQLGFDLVGITSADPIAHSDQLHNYLRNNYQGEMDYLARNVNKRIHPDQLVPGACSVICTALNYYQPDPDNFSHLARGKIARYAWGTDYHLVVKNKLKQLADFISAQHNQPDHQHLLRCFVDTAPLAEKELAARAGLGWIGKNNLLINQQFGSWLVLGEIVTDLPLNHDQPAADQCADCSRCLDACPTQALVQPRTLDARRCISYLTIEAKSTIPNKEILKNPQVAQWIFGCDLCQNTCPFNQNTTAAKEPGFQPRHYSIKPDQLLKMSHPEFEKHFAHSPLLHADWNHLRQLAKQLAPSQAE